VRLLTLSVAEVDKMKWFTIVLLVLLVACAPKPVPQPTAPESIDISVAENLGKPMKCVSEVEGQTSTIYLKGSQMRMDTMPADAHGIYTSDALYTWRGSEGMTIKIDDLKKLAAEQGEKVSLPSQDQIIEKAKKEKAKCESADVPESLFVPPANVKFEDLGEMMKQIDASAKGMQK